MMIWQYGDMAIWRCDDMIFLPCRHPTQRHTWKPRRPDKKIEVGHNHPFFGDNAPFATDKFNSQDNTTKDGGANQSSSLSSFFRRFV